MEITPFKKDDLLDMAELFVRNFRKFRTDLPLLPNIMEDPDQIVGRLAALSDRCPGIVAREGGQVVGYLGWFLVEHFRSTERRGAYCPEWGHATTEVGRPEIYRAMYREAARQWLAAGCGVHAITLLAHDHVAEKTWFWNGFGLIAVDGIRSIEPLDIPTPADFCVQKATLDDAEALAALESEHRKHYLEPPILMPSHAPRSAAEITQFLRASSNGIWIARDGTNDMGYVLFERNVEGACAVVEAPDKIACTAAFVRPQYRGRRASPAMLDAALRYYTAQGYRRCSVDFESINPEARAFWLKYFEPVCFSVVRVPERC